MAMPRRGRGSGHRGRPPLPDELRSRQAIQKAARRSRRTPEEIELDKTESATRHMKYYISRSLLDNDEWLFEQALAASRVFCNTDAMKK